MSFSSYTMYRHIDLKISRVKSFTNVVNNRIRLALTSKALSERAEFFCVVAGRLLYNRILKLHENFKQLYVLTVFCNSHKQYDSLVSQDEHLILRDKILV